MSTCSSTSSSQTATTQQSQIPTSLTPQGLLSHSGRWIIDQYGRVLLFHGTNEVVKSPPYEPAATGFNAADAEFLAKNGFRIVRLGVLATGLMPTPGNIDENYINSIASTVEVLKNAGIYTLIDFHQDGYGPSIGSDGFPTWLTDTNGAINNGVGFPLYYISNPAIQNAFQSFWDNAVVNGKPIQTYYDDMFKSLAKKFARSTSIIGYDLFNEPWPGLTWQNCLNDPNGCKTLDQKELNVAYTGAVKAIRSQGDNHIIFGEPFVLFNFGTSTTSISLPGNDPNSGMSFHMYTLSASDNPNVINNAIAWSKQTNGALLNTEWGATTNSSEIQSQSELFNSAMVPWIFWSLGEMIKNVSLAPSTSNLTSSTLSSLVQPYPLAVAGTPISDTYNFSSSTLTFTYSTLGVNNKPFPDGSVTSFAVPSYSYPTGYSVSVIGGKLSSGCGNTIGIVANKGQSKVSVTVGPGKECT